MEILVAFAILSLSLGVIFQLYSTSLTGASKSDLHSKAAIIATNQLARVGTDVALEEGMYSGEAIEGFRWSMRIESYSLSDGELQGVDPFRVSVKVTREGDEAFAYTLTTMKLATR